MINSYVTLADFKAFLTVRGQPTFTTTDTSDDAVMQSILEDVSRYIDTETRRTFYPRYEIRKFSVPTLQNSPRALFMDDDLLAAVTVTNGDGTVVDPTVYNLEPINYSPKCIIRIIGPASIFWIFNGVGSIEYVISVEGWWGFHNRYTQRAWTQIDTLGAAITDTTTLTFTTTGQVALANEIIKIDTEIFNIASVGTKTITVNQRGDNGSTAVTHLNAAPIYQWNVQPEITATTKTIAQSLYMARNGQVSSGKVTVSAGGIVIRPEDIPPMAQKTIDAFTRSL